jgi:hypothetical protein
MSEDILRLAKLAREKELARVKEEVQRMPEVAKEAAETDAEKDFPSIVKLIEESASSGSYLLVLDANFYKFHKSHQEALLILARSGISNADFAHAYIRAYKDRLAEWHCQVQPTVPTTYPICR